MIDASTVYWVMQADEIRSGLADIAFGTGFFGVILGVAGAGMVAFSEDVGSVCAGKWGRRVLAISITLLLSCLLVNASRPFIPTTNTAATMIVLPAIVNNEDIQNEAKELYDIAKEALRGMSPESAKAGE